MCFLFIVRMCSSRLTLALSPSNARAAPQRRSGAAVGPGALLGIPVVVI